MSKLQNPLQCPTSPQPAETEREPLKFLPVVWALRMALHAEEGPALLSCSHRSDEWLAVVGPWVSWPDELRTMLALELIEDLEIADEEDEMDNQTLLEAIHWETVDWSDLSRRFSRSYARQPEPIKQAMAATLAQMEQCTPRQDAIIHNVSMLSGLFDLSRAEAGLLLLTAIASENKAFQTLLCQFEYNGLQKTTRFLSILLALPEGEVALALGKESALLKSGLIRVVSSPSQLIELMLLTEKLAGIIGYPHESLEALMGHFITRPVPGELEEADYPHLKAELKDLEDILRRTIQGRQVGVNILLYGAPGTGKSEFAKLTGSRVSARVYEVGSDDGGDGAADKNQRYLSYNMAQHFLKGLGDSLILFDEVEDVLLGEGSGMLGKLLGLRGGHEATGRKAWINHLLESNPVPAVWVCNEIDSVDPAFLRRFLYHIEFRVPPRAVRERIAVKHLKGLEVSPACLDRLTQYENLSPAQLKNASLAVRLAAPATPQDTETLLFRNVHNSMTALGQLMTATPSGLVTGYGLDYLNIEGRYPVEQIVRALSRNTKASLCLYGPPGTGKTQLAHHIAKSLDKPLLAKRASDLLGKYVGESERNIASMFREARSEQSVLLLDEADSLLRDRQGAQQAWQVSQVNELLQQMEAFDGIFICATNLFEHLDAAALRRFSFKLRFGYLSPEQRFKMFLQEAEVDEGRMEAGTFRTRLNRLDTLTPGDFATVKRQMIIMGETPAPADFLAQLEEECAIKQDSSGQFRPIGFVH